MVLLGGRDILVGSSGLRRGTRIRMSDYPGVCLIFYTYLLVTLCRISLEASPSTTWNPHRKTFDTNCGELYNDWNLVDYCS